MGRIKNKSRYPIKTNPVEGDFIIGTDSENKNKTVSFNVGTVAGDNSEVFQDNKPKVINYGVAFFDGFELSVASTINRLPSFTIASNEIAYFEGVVYPADRSPVSYRRVFVTQGLGKGVYGVGGTQIIDQQLRLIENEQLTEFPDFILDNPNAEVDERGEVGDTAIEEVVNTGNPFFINDEEVYFFDVLRDGSRVLYGFLGNSGLYGSGSGNVLDDSDFFVVFEESFNNIIQNTSDLVNDGDSGDSQFVEFQDIAQVATTGSFNDLVDVPDVEVYTLSPISGTNTLDLLKDGVSVSQIDLTPYLDDTNLARITQGVVDPNTGIATITRDDNSTFTIDFSSLIDPIPNEEQIFGTAEVELNATGSLNYNVSTSTTKFYQLTGNTDITLINTPSLLKSVTRTLLVQSTNAETLTLNGITKTIGEYSTDPNILNRVILEITDYGAVKGVIIIATIENII